MVGRKVSRLNLFALFLHNLNFVKSFSGESLGKNQNGIKIPIKAHRKTNLAGLGSSTSADITGNNWWERVYNEASDNLSIGKNSNGKISVTKKDEDGVEITNKTYSMKKLKEKSRDMTYGGKFLKAATLLADVGQEKEIADHVKTEDIQVAPTKPLSDAELFAACGGLTAHKGARHGLKLTGKLNRLAEQDDILLAKLKLRTEPVQEGIFREIGTDQTDLKTPEWQNAKEKLKKPKFLISSIDDHPNVKQDELIEVLNIANYSKKSKKKRKKERKTELELIEQIESALKVTTGVSDEDSNGDFVVDEEQTPRKGSKTSKLEKLSDESRAIQKKKKQGKKSHDRDYLTEKALEMIDAINDSNDSVTVEMSKASGKKSKKKRKQKTQTLPSPPLSVPLIKKPPVKLKTDTDSDSSANEVDVVERINEEMHHLGKKRRIDRCEEFTTEFEQGHKNRYKKFKSEEADDDEEENDWSKGKKKLTRKQKKMEKNLCKKLEETI